MSDEVIELSEALDAAHLPGSADLVRELPLPPGQAIEVLAQVWQSAQKEMAVFRLFGSRLPQGQALPGLAEADRAERLSRNAFSRALREVYDDGAE